MMGLSHRKWRGPLFFAIVLALLSFGCAEDAEPDDTDADDLAFPWDGEANGKTDTFGRSLVGAPNPFTPEFDVISDPDAAEDRLATNMRERRELAWATLYKVLEPVPLVGLANQLEARPDCPAGVEVRDLEKCGNQRSEDSCVSFESGGNSEICSWDTNDTVCTPACDSLAVDGVEIPEIPRWQTWYGVEDINRIFKHAYGQLSEEERLAREPFSDLVIGRALQANHTEIERSSRWPLWRYTSKIDGLFDCPLEQGTEESDEDYGQRCAELRQSQFSGASAAGGGIARMIYSPAMVLHVMRNYGEILDCRDDKLVDSWCADGEPCEDPGGNNFSTCFKSEFPMDAGNPWEALDPEEAGDVAGLPPAGGTVLVKATWSRVGFGFELPAFDTDAEALTARLGPGETALWGEDGDRSYETDPNDPEAFPTAEDIYTIRTRTGAVYRLTGLHVMTKELRHWQWITIWWSDEPEGDFGADRPDYFEDLGPAWQNYKMCVVVDYMERDGEVLDRYEDLPSLQAALAATNPEPGQPSWCSNPYIEHGAGNARTNCIGCHQHAGSRYMEDGETSFDLEAIIANESANLTEDNPFPLNGRTRRRSTFATDYSWAFSRLDDLTELMRSEVEFNGTQDERWQRLNGILSEEGEVAAGEEVFRSATMEETCTDCHGASGEGGFGPNLNQVFAQKTDWQLLHTIVEGRDPMPAWGDRLSDQQLTDLMTYLKATFRPVQ